MILILIKMWIKFSSPVQRSRLESAASMLGTLPFISGWYNVYESEFFIKFDYISLFFTKSQLAAWRFSVISKGDGSTSKKNEVIRCFNAADDKNHVPSCRLLVSRQIPRNDGEFGCLISSLNHSLKRF